MNDLKSLYETDTAAWSEKQAAALRAAARGGSNQLLHWENLAEEIEDLAKSLRRRLRSQIARIVQHQVTRLDIDRILEDSPSLKHEISRLIEIETASAVQLAILALEEHGEIDQMELPTIKAGVDTEEQVLGNWFPEEPPR